MFAALHAPNSRLQAILRRRPDLAGKASALIDGVKPRILQVNAAAAGAHIAPGMTPTQGLARLADLALLTPDPAAERAVLDCLLQQAELISPFLEATAEGVVTVELPAERPISPQEWQERVIDPLEGMGISVRVGVAATPDFAFLAAQHANRVRIVDDNHAFVSPLPLAALSPSPALQEILENWGVHTVGDLLALPMSQVCDRLGTEAVSVWEIAQGGSSRPLVLVKPPERFEESMDIEFPVETLEPLLFLLRRFLDQLSRRLEAVYLVAAEVKLSLRFDTGTHFERSFLLPRPTRSVEVLFRLLHSSLENFTSEAPIIGVGLSVIPCRPAAEQFGLLEKGLKDPFAFSEMLGRLQALVGAGRVGTPRLEDSYRPDAVTMEAYQGTEEAGPESPSPALGPGLMRFRPPLHAMVTMAQDRPSMIRSDRVTGRVLECLGPWQGSGHWWDMTRWRREEWDIAIENAYYRLARIGREWVIEGIYG